MGWMYGVELTSTLHGPKSCLLIQMYIHTCRHYRGKMLHTLYFPLRGLGLGFDIYLGLPYNFLCNKLKLLAGPFRFSDQKGIVTHLS